MRTETSIVDIFKPNFKTLTSPHQEHLLIIQVKVIRADKENCKSSLKSSLALNVLTGDVWGPWFPPSV